MIDKNGHDWRCGKLSQYERESGGWRYGGQGQAPDANYNRHVFNQPEDSTCRDGEWWAPCNADGSPRPWPVAKPQTPEWRKISCATDLTGYWLCGGIGAEPNYCPLRTGGGFHRTGSGEWWAPVNADGTPRSWPELEAGIKKKTGASPVTPQPAPRPGTVDVWPLVIEDMRRRDADGRRQYGTPLQAHNGRDALVDAYHEALDLAVYLRQEIVQREDAAAEIAALQAENDRLRVKIACLSDLANLAASESQSDRESEIHTAHALVYLRVARERKRLGIDDVRTVVKMLQGLPTAGADPSSGMEPPWPREADNVASYEELDARVVELEALLEVDRLTNLANHSAVVHTLPRESEVHTAHALVYLHVARAVPADREYWLRLARESREHAREARKEERIPAF